MKIAVIPARGGSKRIPRKNIRAFAGKPMIAYAIDAAQRTGLFDHIVVSTDDREVAAVARDWGAETPFERPAVLADDRTATVPVIAHAVLACRSLGWSFDHVCCVYPTVPLLRPQDIQDALTLLQRSAAAYCFPVAAFPSAVQRALKRHSDGRMEPMQPGFENVPTQELEPAYHDAGQFYWAKAQTWLQSEVVHGDGVGYLIPSWRVVDIDTPDDWVRAEMLYKSI